MSARKTDILKVWCMYFSIEKDFALLPELRFTLGEKAFVKLLTTFSGRTIKLPRRARFVSSVRDVRIWHFVQSCIRRGVSPALAIKEAASYFHKPPRTIHASMDEVEKAVKKLEALDVKD